MNFIWNSLLGIAINGSALYFLTYFLPEVIATGGIKTFVLGGIIIGIINTFVKPLIKLISLPLVFLTGGLFLIVINAGVLWITSYIFEVAKFRDVSLTFPNFGSYVIGAIAFGIINWILHLIIKKD